MRFAAPGIVLLTLACANPVEAPREAPDVAPPGPAVPAASSAGIADYLAEMDEVGKVEIQSDPSVGRGGRVKFILTWHQAFTYRNSWERRGGVTIVRIHPRIRLTTNLRHEIRMPTGRREEGWYARVLAHEYDHVAVSLDERPRLVFEHLVESLDALTAEVPGAPAVDSALVGRLINERVNEIGRAITRLIQQHYALLDTVTKNSMRDMPDRERFFRGLYTHERLLEFDFPFVDEVRGMLGSPENESAKLWYRW